MQHLILNKGVFFLRIVVGLVVAGFQKRTVRFFRCRNNFRSRETRQPASSFRQPWSAATEAARLTRSMTGVPGWLETTLEVAGEALTRELMLTTSFEQGEPFAVVAGVVVAGMT